MSRVYIGLGSNQDDPPAQLAQALRALSRLPGSRVVALSKLYWSPPAGDPDQPDYLNAVAEIETALAPPELLAALQAIEYDQGRRRDPARRYGPRPLDLDILLYNHQVIRTPELTVPHPRLAERAFVLAPLYELAPQLTVPTLGEVQRLLAGLPAGQRAALRPAQLRIWNEAEGLR
ncbi:MAG: 2-amino-4-hydroxy-6-hydroxymethyldihydropteridine diphosphokinase [Wenzhouxiangellaceae bacterium]